MSETQQVAVGQRWRFDGEGREFVLAKRGEEFAHIGNRYITWWDTNGEPWYERVGGTITNCTLVSSPPSQSPEGPRVGVTEVGQVWRYVKCVPCGDSGCFECLRPVTKISGSIVTYSNGWTNNLDWHDGKRMVLHAPASPGKEVAKCQRCEELRAYSCGYGFGCDACGKQVRGALGTPAPATPAGPPAKPVQACWKCNKRGEFPSRHHPDEPFGPSPMCEPCYLRFENRLPNCPVQDSEPLPRDHWRPAIESLGGVRPFGRPRGWRR